MPEIIHLNMRKENVIEAINKYSDANFIVPEEWIMELNFLNNRIALLSDENNIPPKRHG